MANPFLGLFQSKPDFTMKILHCKTEMETAFWPFQVWGLVRG